jgi:hypothetical protein
VVATKADLDPKLAFISPRTRMLNLFQRAIEPVLVVEDEPVTLL